MAGFVSARRLGRVEGQAGSCDVLDLPQFKETNLRQHSGRRHGLRFLRGAVEKAIRATPGVVSASVDLATKRAEVIFSGIPDIAAVIAAIGVAGYECMVENATSSDLR